MSKARRVILPIAEDLVDHHDPDTTVIGRFEIDKMIPQTKLKFTWLLNWKKTSTLDLRR